MAMVFYDLTNTAVATSARPIRPPGDLELFAITVGLLLVEDRGFGELASASLELTHLNRRRVAEMLEERAPSLAREFGTPSQLRARLAELAGLVITRDS
ncbi:MAG: hypothetical protein IPM64_12545 [Phycisphaerales bacterium]|nr:hypothetical protein [Phycisphaerales bacterium]